MKKTLLFVAVLVAAISMNAQRTVDIATTLTSPVANATIKSNQAISMTFTIKNNGPDVVKTTDTLTFIQVAANTIITSSSFFLANPLAKDSSISLTVNTAGIQGGQSGTNPLNLCALIVLNYRSGVDTVKDNVGGGNNLSCVTVNYTNTASVSDDYSASKLAMVIYPNPVSNTGTINYTLISSDRVSVKVFDITGRLVSTLFEGVQEAGDQTISFDASSLKAGIYFTQLSAGGLVTTSKMIVE